ncbi:hypothetical protein [Nostoc sp. ChiQUE01b]|uniref:hypothetical protein n=1 Tax=Nostoc sp. ChiQUE01b TaxID=3075376 RepID=UPI002AD56085|nr:hypothetical protein [Nostoc sp. ChiQUE01b]
MTHTNFGFWIWDLELQFFTKSWFEESYSSFQGEHPNASKFTKLAGSHCEWSVLLSYGTLREQRSKVRGSVSKSCGMFALGVPERECISVRRRVAIAASRLCDCFASFHYTRL